jgi:sulfur-carrier protein
MPQVWIPSLLRDLTGGQETVVVQGTRVGEVIEELDQRFPGVKSRLCDGVGLRPGIALVVGTEVSGLGLGQPVEPDSEVHFLPAIGGG